MTTLALLSTPTAAGIVLLAALVVLVLLIVLLLRAGEKSTFSDAAAPPPEPAPADEPAAEGWRGAGPLAVRGAFRRAMARLDRHAAGPEPRYRLPWFLLAGEEGSRPVGMLGRAGLALPFGPPPETGLPIGRRCDWWFLERGVVLDLGGSYFEAEDGGRASGLEPILRLLQRSRPRRPLDGVVLTLSAEELHRASRAGSAGRSQLEERAGRVCRALWRAQRRLGLTLPVYVVVTDCDVVPGFADFARALPERRHREMLGWSSPYSVDTAYRGEWVDEAFAALAHRLDQIQGEIFTDRGAGTGGAAAGVDPDRVFVFPHAFATLARPLRSYLDPIFRPSSYHETLILRGVYFSGALPDASAAGERGRVLFVRDVLESKAFPESGLGGPLPATVVARNRRLAALQAAVVAGALVLGAGTWLAYARLQDDKEFLEPVLDEMSQHVRQARIEKASPGGLDPDDVERWTQHLFGTMAAIDFDRFGSPFLPSSWFSPINRRLRISLGEAYEEIVFEAMSLGLRDRAADLTEDFSLLDPFGPVGAGGSLGAAGGSPYAGSLGAGTVSVFEDGTGAVVPLYPVGGDDDGAGAAAPLVDVSETPEFEELRAYVAALGELESVGDVYNRLDQSREVSDLARVLDYLFGIELPAEFFDHDALYRQAQSRATLTPFDPGDFRDPAAAKAESLAARLNRRLFADNELLATLEVATTGIRQLAGASWPSNDESWRVRAVAEELRRVEDLIGHPGASWAFQPTFDLGPGFRQVLSQIEASELLGPEVAARVERAAEGEWLAYRRRLTGYTTQLTGPLLALDRGQPQLGPDTLLLQANLDRFLGQSFAAETEPTWLAAEMPPGVDLDWDLDLLRRAVGLYEPYQRFRENTLPLSPPEVRPALDSVARERLGANMVSLIAEAQSFEPLPDGRSASAIERRLRQRVAAFEAAAEPLSQLLTRLDELGLWQAREDLTDLVVQQGGRLLSQVDHLLGSRAPYAPRQGGFGWWDGAVPAGLAAYDVESPDELASYLQLQRQRLEGIAREYAEPLVTWLEQTGAANDPSVRSLVRRWDGILAALDDHAAQKPGNSVARLEEFIGQDMASLTLDGCFAAIPARATATAGSDYFLENRERLRSDLLARCRALAADRAVESYAELADLFNRRLAGRYPFADSPDAAYVAEAAPEDVRGFFRRFDAVAPLLREAGSAEGTTGAGLPRAALDFVDEMTRVRRFFAPYLDAETPAPAPLYDVAVDFRVNRAAEVGGSQIIEWALDVGRERLTNRSETLRTRWGPGEPVRLTLRWASDSPREPVATSVPEVRAWSSVEGRTVTYEFRNRWSLLSAFDVLRARPRDVQAHASLDPGTLYLGVDTRRAGSERVDPEPAEVFVRLSVLAPDGTETLTVPRFPSQAPALRGRGETL